jgi:hypothetical protein
MTGRGLDGLSVVIPAEASPSFQRKLESHFLKAKEIPAFAGMTGTG